MKGLLDGDIIAYRSAAASENEDFGICRYYIEQCIDQIVQGAGLDEFEVFLSGSNNFRYDVYPEYKANRDNQPQPRHRKDAVQYLKDTYSCSVSEGCEADDLMGIAQCAPGTNYGDEWGHMHNETVICSLDKDLLMIPGNYYSWEISGKAKGIGWTKSALWAQTLEIDALRHFYKQCITGDVADNLKGIPGRGIKYANSLLDDLETEQEMFDAVREAYDMDDAFLMNARCLWIWRKPDDDWIHHFERLKNAS